MKQSGDRVLTCIQTWVEIEGDDYGLIFYVQLQYKVIKKTSGDKVYFFNGCDL